MKHGRLVVFMVASLVWATTSCKLIKSDMVAVQPVQFDGKHWRPYRGDSLFYRNLEQVLKHYDEEVEWGAGGKLLIRRWLNEDRELIWNYTTKANDPEWFSKQGLQSAIQ